MNKKMLLSIVLITLVAGGAIATTYAYFTAQRTASTNKFTQGTLDLNVQSGGVANEPFVIENMGEDANISGSKTWKIKNTGTLPGRLTFGLQNLVNSENGCNDQEKIAEPNCEADTEGELGGVVNLIVDLDGNKKVESTLSTANVGNFAGDWDAQPQVVVAPNQEVTITARWSADAASYGNEIQSDGLTYDVNFGLVQLGQGTR